MSFWAYCSKQENERRIYLRRFTSDKKNYFIVPEEQKSLDLHPLIKSAKKANFSKLNQSLKGGYRHVELPLKDSDGKQSKEAKQYIDSDGHFVIDNKRLKPEENASSKQVKLAPTKQISFDSSDEEDGRKSTKRAKHNSDYEFKPTEFIPSNQLVVQMPPNRLSTTPFPTTDQFISSSIGSFASIEHDLISIIREHGKFKMFTK